MTKGKARNKMWLNDSHEEHGSISWHVNPHSEYWRGSKSYISADVRMSDCSKYINLEFDADNPKEGFKRLQKIETLLKELEAFRDTYKDALEAEFKVKFFQ